MTPETRILVQYRLDRAREALAEAVLLLDSGHANTGVNRLYYACFYAYCMSRRNFRGGRHLRAR